MGKFKRIICLLLILALFLSLVGCSTKIRNKPLTRTEFLLGTIVTVNIYQDANPIVLDKVFERIKDIDNKMSKNIKDSDIYKVNINSGNDYIKVSEDVFDVIKRGIFYSKLSNGKFDITIGPLVELWGIGTDRAKVPSEEEINNTIKLIDYKKILLDEKEKKVKLMEKGMKIDLGGIAKGYAADEVADILINENVKHAIINLGGNIFALGSKPDGSPWNIGVQNPFTKRGDYIGIVKVIDKTVVTSGVYERYFEQNGKRYHHILDPYTGYPVENSLVSVSIITNKSIDADALSTVAFSLGLSEGKRLIENLDGVEAIFITKDKRVFITDGLNNTFKLTNPDFHMQK
ncbi:thiamine biosynthesis protein ApbE [Caloranaerobacter sp. TR13]|uniref:FAD:protein FMN transferase n=1 Tax=Caloranaerobacter sp. TR13 TaxID=1302151 RepID=UPI0006D471A0|nr:FAD:protein FMN transferase [Caloranaerobacter sp. TR13]KPU27180.1 thiamine biosynthesis protein ApbE [Caloranaerobacter sp. TR13]